MRMRLTTIAGMALGVAVALAVAAPAAEAQRRPTTRRAQPIEIRGQVPTPQVVTVRPREVPAYSRRVLVPGFYDHDFWATILPAYQLVPGRMLTGNVRLDSLARGAADTVAQRDSLRARAAIGAGLLAPRVPMGSSGLDSLRRSPMAPAGTATPGTPMAPRTPPDTARPPSGTSPARTPR